MRAEVGVAWLLFRFVHVLLVFLSSRSNRFLACGSLTQHQAERQSEYTTAKARVEMAGVEAGRTKPELRSI